MIREQRSKEKLEYYYRKYINDNVLDPNVHPWVADSWQKSREIGVPNDFMPTLAKLPKSELAARQEKNDGAIKYLNDFYREIREFFNIYNLSLLLLDADCYVLKSYSLPFFQKTPGQIEGARLSEQDIGTSSISIARDHRVPFLIFGPEMWVEECQMGDACSAPIIINGQLEYIVTLVSVEQQALPYSSVVSLLLSIKHAMEKQIMLLSRLKAQQAILDAAPFAVYHIMPGGEVAYTNKLGQSRLAGIGGEDTGSGLPNLNDVVLNYRHTPIYKGFNGVPSYNKEVTWITPRKTYEDITTVVPLERDSDQTVNSVVAVSLPIEDLRTLVAHAVGYTARYSLASMIGDAAVFINSKDKAARVARNSTHLLLQGEAGTGKERMAHGIHQASTRAAGPFIAIKCGGLPPERLEEELFGIADAPDISRPGKLELANGGTLFMDEIEKLPKGISAVLAEVLAKKAMRRIGDKVERSVDVRIIAACDSDLKRLTERGAFAPELYDIIAKNVIRVPALRTRKEDIPALAEHIISEVAEQHQIGIKRILPETAELLKSYEWPGNIKQLQGVVEYAFFNTTSDEIRPEDINLMGDIRPDTSWKEDRDVFIKAWQAAGGNISRLANMLDVSRVTLYRYLKKYGLEKA
ncbi:sigma-54-dependent Fis family transcriptional regulator [Dendrosporobacter sp. 1207_IL3150]|uniref:sigma-54-dependent Fis family transcriptional regulator n=1 Tax=Dendrosporobacter sp. 1207_IL3150 TaxID=3084054 RepID=UPI002FD8EDC3